MNKPPSRVKIGHRSYRITSSPQAHLEAEAKEGQRLWGRIDHSQQTITLDPQMGANHAPEVLLHEVLHGVISLTGGLTPKDTETEDGIITRLQNGLLGVLRENPALVAYLTKKAT